MSKPWPGTRTVSEELADHLKREIQQGTLPLGTRLRQNEIAERYGVSSTPIREAFAQLQAQGLVRISRRRGAVVFRPTAAELRESHEIREALEILAVRKAVPNLTEQKREELAQVVEEMEATHITQRWVELNHAFHLSLYQSANSPRLVRMIESLRDATGVYLHMFAAMNAPAYRGDDEHKRILIAVTTGDVDSAVKWTSKHVISTVDRLMTVLPTEEHNDE